MPIFNIRENVDGRWTVAEGAASMEHVPVVEMIQFFQSESAVSQALGYWQDVDKKFETGSGVSPYDNLYNAQPTGNIYYLPYLSRYHHGVQQTWDAGAGPGYDNNLALKWKLIAEQFKSPAAGVEQPHAWAGQNLAEYTISFPLINTFRPDEDIPKNWTFVLNILWTNMLGRPNAIAYTPPCIYTINIPGIRYSPAATMSLVSIQNMGAMHYHSLGGKGFNIPDAWAVELKVKELILESREILEVAMKIKEPDTVTAGLVRDGAQSVF